MRPSLTTRIFRHLLILATITLVGAATINYHQRHSFALPTDGVQWGDSRRGPQVIAITPGSPAARVGIKPGDRLRSIDGLAIREVIDITRSLDRVGMWRQTSYALLRGSTAFQAKLVIEPSDIKLPLIYYFQWLLAVVYLAIGVFVFVRRSSRPMVCHFYAFCLSSFVLYSFSYTGELSGLDRFIYWGDVWATMLVPAIFLHFCLVFPQAQLVSKVRLRAAKWSYVPAAVLIALYHLTAAGIIDFVWPLIETRALLDRFGYALLGTYLLSGAAVLQLGIKTNENTSLYQQRKWLTRGTLAGAIPFVALYLIPFAAGWTIGPKQSLAVFSLALIPLAFSYAIIRFRLMDIDLILRRSIAYTLAAAFVLTSFYGLGALLSKWAQIRGLFEFSPALWILSVIAAALLFQPLRNQIQAKLERRFYQERYDYRHTLVDFASELRTETDPDQAVLALSERLVKTLDLRRLAIVGTLAPPINGEKLQLLRGVGLTNTHGEVVNAGTILNLSFLTSGVDWANCREPHYFVEDPRNAKGLDAASRQTVLDLDLHYYVPCSIKGRPIAYLGLGCTTAGDYLSSEDLTLVSTVSGYFAAALENARLVSSLENQLTKNERLKDYNQNILESLNVGVLALDLDDRVESWNTQLELTFGIARSQAIGQTLDTLLPPDLVKELDHIRDNSETKNIYKFLLRAETFPTPFQPPEPSNGTGSGEPAVLTLNIAATPLVTKDSKPIGRLIIFDDVTERVGLEEQLVQAEKLSSIGLLAAGIAHEVNTPLSVISSYAQMLAKHVSDDPSQTRMLDKITSQTFRASKIVNSLLNVSRTSPREFVEIDLNQTVINTLALIEPQLRKVQIEVECKLDAGPATVVGNADRVQQVLLNLLLNARDAMPQGGQLLVSNQIRDNANERFVEITVKDTGPGIEPAHVKRVFDPFFTTKTQQSGTGLGLAVSYGIVREHLGRMSVESELGRGTSFLIELPLAQKPIHV